MINRIIHFSVYHRAIILLLTCLLGGIGWLAFQELPIDAVPDITNVQVQINTAIEGLAPEEIERSITLPVETAMAGISGVTQVRSFTRFHLSQVTVVFEDDVDIYRARQLISERLMNVTGQLPKNAQPKLGPVSTGLGEIFRYAVKSEAPASNSEARLKQLTELRTLEDWYIKPRLLTLKGVAEVNAIGGHEKQYHVQPSPERMAKYGIHFSDIVDALGRTNQNAGGGYIQQTAEQFLVQAVGLLKSVEDIRAVPIRSLETMRTITIGDVAEVGLARELRTGAASVRGQEEVIGSAFMLMGENSRTVSMRVAQRLKEIQADLPAGIKIEVLYDRSDLVNATLGTVRHNLLTGAFLVIIVLLLLIGNIRAAMITAVTIPLSLLFTFIVMKRAGISGNLMSLGALDFGIIVDGTVIVLDNCVRLIGVKCQELQRKLTREEVQTTVYEAASQIRKAAGFGELVVIAVFIPIFALVGIEGKMFKPMAATFSFAVASALLLSFTTVPALASLFLSGKSSEREPWLMKKASHAYAPLLERALKYKSAVVAIAVISILTGVFLFLRMGGEFLPQLDEGSFNLEIVRPAEISLDQSIALDQKTEEIILTFPEVANAFAILGTGEIAADPMGINQSDLYIMLREKNSWPEIGGRKRTKAELGDAIRAKLESDLPGQRFLVTQPIQMRFNELLEGTKADITVKVFGEDMDRLAELTNSVADAIRKIKGASDVEVELRGKSPILKVMPKKNILARLGVSTNEVLETVGTALGGQEAGSIYEGTQRFPLIVRLSETYRSDLNAINNLPVGIAANATIPLKDAATLKFEQAYGSIFREQSKRRAAVMVNVRGRDTESFVKEAQSNIHDSIKMPPGYYVEWGGNFQNLQEARSRLMILSPIALVLVLMMIYAAFGNLGETLLIFTGVPLALVGGVIALLCAGLPFSISAGVGFIALSGIAVLNGVVLVNYFNFLQTQGISGNELVKQGTLIRLRPVLMTALVDIFGFLPMMMSQSEGGEVQRPLATVVIGGIISSTLLTLIVLPVLYIIFESKIAKKIRS